METSILVTLFNETDMKFNNINELNNIDKNLFKSLEFNNLTFNEIFDLKDYTDLEELFIYNCTFVNNLKNLTTNIKILKITDCDLEYLKFLVLSLYGKLEYLDLHNNKLYELPSSPFLSKIKYFNISNNKLTELPNWVATIYYDCNVNLDNNDFWFLKPKETFDLVNISDYYVEIANRFFTEEIKQNLIEYKTNKELVLKKNLTDTLPKLTIDDFTNLINYRNNEIFLFSTKKEVINPYTQKIINSLSIICQNPLNYNDKIYNSVWWYYFYDKSTYFTNLYDYIKNSCNDLTINTELFGLSEFEKTKIQKITFANLFAKIWDFSENNINKVAIREKLKNNILNKSLDHFPKCKLTCLINSLFGYLNGIEIFDSDLNNYKTLNNEPVNGLVIHAFNGHII
jgi:hypothetical protein